MKTIYKILNNELIINIRYINKISSLNDLRNIINQILIKNNILFKGKIITIYLNGIKNGSFYLTNYYLKTFFNINSYYLTETNNYFINFALMLGK